MLKMDPKTSAAFDQQHFGGLGTRVIEKVGTPTTTNTAPPPLFLQLLSLSLFQYREEFKRLQEKKKEHLPEFLADARETLTKWWDALFFTEEERAVFTPAFTDTVSEEALRSHEKEIERLEAKYAEDRELLQQLQAHDDLLKEIEEFEESTNNPERLISRSSQRDPGRLLREERFRNKVATQLPKMEAGLRVALGAYQATHQRTFLVFGRDYLERLDELEEVRLRGKKTPMKTRPTGTAGTDATRSPTSAASRKVSLAVTPSKTPRPSISGTLPLTPSGKANLPRSATTPGLLSKVAPKTPMAPATPSLKRKVEEAAAEGGRGVTESAKKQRN